MRSLAVAAMLLALAIGCRRSPPGPAALDTRHDTCAHCRMAVSDVHFAAQLVAPGEEPRFFDDIGCLRDWLHANPRVPARAIAFVADHGDGRWVPAASAVYVRVPGLQTPMGSHLIAHVAAMSTAADPSATGGTQLTAADVFGPSGPPNGAP
ncbi:MAG TPA: nitrous oxide reductase accessory protein NosL [Anaeromyxobacteraceae bacterium]|nr:nitrous oxide reductase accessory protein NosL [Anaeromyxobacteraceae bacterium]